MKGIDGIFNQIQPVTNPVNGVKGSTTTNDSKEAGSFSQMLTKAIGEVDSLQKQADVQVAGLVSGTGNVTPHDAMLALEKADIAFNLMTQIRSKIVRAYEEVMRTQV